jgi:hypothetical protein
VRKAEAANPSSRRARGLFVVAGCAAAEERRDVITGFTALSAGQLSQLAELLGALERALQEEAGARLQRGLPAERHSELLGEIRDLTEVIRSQRVC